MFDCLSIIGSQKYGFLNSIFWRVDMSCRQLSIGIFSRSQNWPQSSLSYMPFPRRLRHFRYEYEYLRLPNYLVALFPHSATNELWPATLQYWF